MKVDSSFPIECAALYAENIVAAFELRVQAASL
jgi:hypothetical protein